MSRSVLCSLFVLALACGPTAPQDGLGGLSLGLTTEAGGSSYRLVHARFSLDGPELRTLRADGEETLDLELVPGAYALTLLPGWGLERFDPQAPDTPGTSVAARLVSENPIAVSVDAGGVTDALWRFEIAGTAQTSDRGHLSVGLAVDTDGAPLPATCDRPQIAEFDYEQAGSDEAEFVEILNAGSCASELADVALELVNGGDGQVYARYALGDAAALLTAGERMLVADPAVPGAGKRVALRGSGIQNGPDGLRLVRGDQLLDAVAYRGLVPGVSEGTQAGADDETHSNSRCPDGADSDDNGLDFMTTDPTPLAENACE